MSEHDELVVGPGVDLKDIQGLLRWGFGKHIEAVILLVLNDGLTGNPAFTIAAVLFMLTSITLSIAATRQGAGTRTVLDKTGRPTTKQSAPAPAPAKAPQQQKAPTK